MERYNNQTLKRLQKDGTDNREDVNILHIRKILPILNKKQVKFKGKIMFDYNKIPNSAAAAGKLFEQQRLLEQKEAQQLAREMRRDEITEQYNNKSLELAEQAKLLSEKSVEFTKLSLWIGGITLFVTTIGAIYTILSFYR